MSQENTRSLDAMKIISAVTKSRYHLEVHKEAIVKSFVRYGTRTLATLGLLLAAGCATVPSEEYAAINRAAIDLESKAMGAVSSIEDSAVATDVRRVVARDAVLLSESDFSHAVTPKSCAALSKQLGAIRSYAGLLNDVGSRAYKGRFAEAVIGAKNQLDASIAAANELAAFATSEDLSKLKGGATQLASAVAALGEVAIDTRAQARTARIVKETDPYISTYLLALAHVFAPSDGTGGAPARHGLAGVISNESQLRKSAIINEYRSLGAAPADFGKRAEWIQQRQQLAREFAGEVRGGELSIALAEALRDACLALRKAHSDLANGEPQSVVENLSAAAGRVNYLADVFKETKAKLEE